MKVVRIRRELQMGPKNLVLWKVLRLGLMFIWGQKKSPVCEWFRQVLFSENLTEL